MGNRPDGKIGLPSMTVEALPLYVILRWRIDQNAGDAALLPAR